MASEQELVARAICGTAAQSVVRSRECPTCESGKCTLWTSFLDEADAAIAVIRTLDMHAQARSILHHKPKKFNINGI